MAIRMLEAVAVGTQPVCSACDREFKTRLPPVLIVLTPKNPAGRAIGTWLCRRCLAHNDFLQTAAAAFSRVLPGVRIEAVQ
jgi:hypothetical protein